MSSAFHTLNLLFGSSPLGALALLLRLAR